MGRHLGRSDPTTDEGWVAEMAVPFKSLRFKPGQTIWGFNIERQIKRRQEHDAWASPRHGSWITNLAASGQISGLAGLRRGWGLDVFKSLTASLTASITVNTDFAETEVDARQINLTGFVLFFPEKRTVSLKGAGVFDVAGLGSQNPAGS